MSACSQDALARSRDVLRSPIEPGLVESSAGSVVPSGPHAVLTISNLSVEVTAPVVPPDGFVYLAKFDLIETTGKSGATIQHVITSVDNGQSESTGECWNDLRVAPGGTLDTFREGWGLSYCAPWTASPTRGSLLSVTVTFLDDDRQQGIVRATADASK